MLLRAGQPCGLTHSTTEPSLTGGTLPCCPQGSSLSAQRALRSWPPLGAEPRSSSHTGSRGALPAETRQAPFQRPSVQVGRSSHKLEEGLGGLQGSCQRLGAQAGAPWRSLPGTLLARILDP